METVVDNIPSLPLINYSKLVEFKTSKDPSSFFTSKNEQQKLFAALRDVGFVYLQNHAIPLAAQQLLFQHAQRFFALPESEKAKIETGESKAFHGWFSPQRTSGDNSRSDQKEAFDIGDDNDPTRPNQWPADWPEIRTDMVSFFEQCHQVHLELLSALAEHVGLTAGFFLPYVQAKDHFFRVLYYPETTGESFRHRFRASPHTDYGTLTLLFNDSQGGLQVRNRAGDFVDAPHLPGAAIVNVGDLLSRWFNDTLKSTEHRVIEPSTFNKSGSEIPDVIPARYSIAWFGHPNRDALIEPIASCCTPENPKKYEPVYAGKHVVERLANLHKDGKNAEKWSDSMARDGNTESVKEVKGFVDFSHTFGGYGQGHAMIQLMTHFE
ncbi:MAG: hypothetical protein LQ343_001147 [Gyalolechia ehrenbergii]|nr:MAG: hypothetical protein LQ343_001147 [Gyalolechia ehrenbergii]